MEPRSITEDFAVSGQLTADQLDAVRAAGYRSIICNRPDGEASDQPPREEIERAAQARALVFRYLPIKGGLVGDDDVAAFDQALRELPRPILAYCRTGTRSATLWSLAEATRRTLPEILRLTKAAGYDLQGVAQRVANGGRTPTNHADATAPR